MLIPKKDRGDSLGDEHSQIERGSFRLEDLGYTPEQILQLCQLVKDPNPWHAMGVIPFYGLLGIASGAIMQKAQELKLLSKPLVTRCVVDFRHTARADQLYTGEVCYTLDTDQHQAEVNFSLRGHDQPIASGLIIARYRT